MKRSLTWLTAVVSSALVGVGVISAGIASADYTGQTYAQAAANIAKSHLTPVVSSVVGDQLVTDDCIVTSSKVSGFLDSSGRQSDKSILLSLNCNEAVAKAGTPGNSVATPEGKKAKKDQGDAEYFSTHPEWCLPGGKYRSPCKKICTKNSSLCTSDMLKAVAAT